MGMKAMILAAGRGERMRPLTDTVPKPLLQAGGKPLIVHAIEALRLAGVTDIVINHAHLGEEIERVLGDGGAHGVKLRYSPETEALETAGGIAKALPLLGPHPFIVANGDVHSDFDFSRLVDALAPESLAHLVLVPNPDHHPDGDFALDGGLVRLGNGPKSTFSGIGVYRPELFRGIVPGEKARLAPRLRTAIDGGQVSCELHAGHWRDIGTPERLAEIDRHLASRA